MPIDPILTTVDYTSRDYYSLRADLISKIQERVAGWTANNPSDFGLGLVEAMAYGMDVLHYYLDRVANESYLQTAVQRDSLYSLAEMFGYTPYLGAPATVSLTFTNTTTKEVKVPTWTRVQAQVVGGDGKTEIRFFETLEEAVLPAKEVVESGSDAATPDDPTIDILAVEGRSYVREFLGVSNGLPSQRFLLGRRGVLPNSVQINVVVGEDSKDAGYSDEEWYETPTLNNPDIGPFEETFQCSRMTDDSMYIVFGDGVLGKIPTLHARIYASYRVGGGTIGNIPATSVDAIVEPILAGVKVTNRLPGTGGKDPEPLDSIRNNAARSFRSRDRAVTIADFLLLSRSLPYVVTSRVDSYSPTSIRVVIAGEDRTPEATSDSIRAETAKYLSDRASAGITIQVFGPQWIQVHLKLSVVVDPSVKMSTADRQCREALARSFSHEKSVFNGTYASSDVIAALLGIAGIKSTTVESISMKTDSEGLPVWEREDPQELPTSPITIGPSYNAIGFVDPIDEESVVITVTGGLTD